MAWWKLWWWPHVLHSLGSAAAVEGWKRWHLAFTLQHRPTRPPLLLYSGEEETITIWHSSPLVSLAALAGALAEAEEEPVMPTSCPYSCSSPGVPSGSGAFLLPGPAGAPSS
jgi:hypothetical protein